MDQVFCKLCTHCIPYVAELDGYQHESMNDPEDGRHICSSGMNVIKNWYGEDRVQLHDKRQQCDQCGAIIADAGQLRYGKCEIRNRLKKCKEFKRRTYWKDVTIFIANVLQGIRNIVTLIRARSFAIFVAWALMHSIVVTQIGLDLFGKIYISLSVLFYVIYVIDRS